MTKTIYNDTTVRVLFARSVAAGIIPDEGQQRAYKAIQRMISILEQELWNTACTRLRTYRSLEAVIDSGPTMKVKDTNGNDIPATHYYACPKCSGYHAHSIYFVRVLFIPVNNRITTLIKGKHPDPFKSDVIALKDASFTRVVNKWMKVAQALEEAAVEQAQHDEEDTISHTKYPDDAVLHEFHSCTRKNYYLTEADAAARMQRLIDAGEELQTYLCVYCSGWHYGHKRREGSPGEILRGYKKQWKASAHMFPSFLKLHGLDESYIPLKHRSTQ